VVQVSGSSRCSGRSLTGRRNTGPGDERGGAGEVGAAGMGHGGVPSGAQAVLWSGEGPGAQSGGPSQPPFAFELEAYRLKVGVSWYEAKTVIVRDAIRTYLAHRVYEFASTA